MLLVAIAFLVSVASATADVITPIRLGSVLSDPNTGLEWLALTETQNISFDFVNQETIDGGEFAGWRVARSSELVSLYNSYSIVPGDLQPGGSWTFDAVRKFVDGIGFTYFDFNTALGSSTYGAWGFIVSDFPGSPEAPLGFADTAGASYGILNNAGYNPSAYSRMGITLNTDQPAEHYGTFLVRDAAPASVPEPSSVILVSTGLAVAFGWRRRNAAYQPTATA
jgi:hypothetical protein